MEYHMFYVEIKKNLRLEEEKNIFLCRVQKKTLGKLTYLPSAKKTLGKQALCRVFFFSTRQTSRFVECCFFCRVNYFRHSANGLFAECPMECTRQIFRHSTNAGFPVALIVSLLNKMLRTMS